MLNDRSSKKHTLMVDRAKPVAISEFAGKLNQSAYFKEAKVQTTLKSIEYTKRAAEFKILAKLRDGTDLSLGVSS